MSLTIVGTVAFDAIETPFGKTDKIMGGAGSYIALTASNFQKKTQLISVVGEDYPKEYLDLLESQGIDIQGIQIKKGEKTFFWSGKYKQNMNERETLTTELNSLESFDPIVPEEYAESEYLLLGNLSPTVQRKVLERMHKRPKLIMLDTMNFWMDNQWEALNDLIQMVDVLCINDEEARQLSGEYNLVVAAEKIQSSGLKYLIIKKGKHGAMLFGEEKIFAVPALPTRQVFDPTGAGDSFAGGFMGYISATQNISFEQMKNAMVAGSVCSSFCIEKFGVENLYNISQAAIQERIRRFEELTRFSI